MQQIVECVPNFSDGRNPAVYNGIADAIRSVAGIHVLNVSADADHNRSVITFVGNAAAVEEAAFRAVGKAAELINLDTHQGEHPRIGATDVFPFIPVKGITIEECVAIARRVGQRVGEELGVAVYLYGSAASSPERTRLPDIRKGQYELWKSEVASNPARKPDFGPAEPKPWGATVIGVRPFLIAYNLYLNSDDVEIADQISKNIRFTGGGLRYLQAKGFLVEGQAQVSMNLTNFSKTPIYRMQELVRQEAARYGLTITKAELVGLMPQQALIDTAIWYLQLHDMGNDQILEQLISQVSEEEVTVNAFLDSVADKSPTPGGGSGAALAGALAAALTQMVAGLTAGRKKYIDFDAESREILARAAELRAQLTEAIAEDAAAFDSLMAAYRNKDLDEAAKSQAVEMATIHAGEVPLNVARLSHQIAQLGQTMVQHGNANAVTDAAAAVIMAHAAVQTAALNVKINAVELKDRDLAASWHEEAAALEAKTLGLVAATKAAAAERGNF